MGRSSRVIPGIGNNDQGQENIADSKEKPVGHPNLAGKGSFRKKWEGQPSPISRDREKTDREQANINY